jgi:hypothetical protein
VMLEACCSEIDLSKRPEILFRKWFSSSRWVDCLSSVIVAIPDGYEVGLTRKSPMH